MKMNVGIMMTCTLNMCHFFSFYGNGGILIWKPQWEARRLPTVLTPGVPWEGGEQTFSMSKAYGEGSVLEA